MKKIYVIMMFTAALALVAPQAQSAETTENSAPATTLAATQPSQPFKWGADIRLRTVYFDNIPYANMPVEARGGVNSFQRYRTRIFGEYHPTDNLYFRGRLVNEFRSYQEPDTPNAWSAFDEVVFDNLFVDYKTDQFDIRVGRQDLIYGTGKVILDGTPKDGSRTIYFDAAKVTFKGIADTTVDFLALYTRARDPLAIDSQDRDLVGFTGAAYDGAEAGGAIYVRNSTNKALPWEAYYIIKTKQDLLDDGDDINTFGLRFMPKGPDTPFDGNLEIAYQSSPDTSEFMVDALVNWRIPAMQKQKGCLGLGWYHLSADWNPVFARWPQYSELYVYSYDTTGAGAWKNISMPHIDFSISPIKGLKSDLLLGYLFAPRDDGLGGGHNRGLLFTWWNRFTIKQKLFSQTDKLGGHLLVEIFDPGDYYAGSQRSKIASFVRAELSYSF